MSKSIYLEAVSEAITDRKIAVLEIKIIGVGTVGTKIVLQKCIKGFCLC